MRVYVSVDMEGVAGVATLDQIVRGGTGYPRAQGLMTDEANAAVRGAFSAGADEVVLSDSHGTMDNLLHDRLDSRARLVTGTPRAGCMMAGLTRDDSLAVLIGYHDLAGGTGVLAHSFSATFTDLRVDGQSMTETQVNALYAAAHNVPVGVVTGDDRICRVVETEMEGVATVVVKRALGFAAADSLSPTESCDRIEQAVADACASVGTLNLPGVSGPFALEVDFSLPLAADLAQLVPGASRVGGRTVQQSVEDAATLVDLISTWYYLAGVAAQQWSAVANRR